MGSCITLNDITDCKEMEGETLKLLENLQKEIMNLGSLPMSYRIIFAPQLQNIRVASLFENDREKENINQTVAHKYYRVCQQFR